jgi:L-lactate dehydrogenase (cytochrome)
MSSTARTIDPLPLYADWRSAARRRLPRLIFDFIDGAAGEEAALHRNESAFRDLPLMPRVLVDPREADLTSNVLGQPLGLPFGCAPMGMCDLAGPGTDAALARAAARWRFPLCISTASSTPLERLAEMSEGHAWFQLYVTGSIEAALSLVDRAEAAGIGTLVLTVDVPRLGKRPRDLRNGFRTPLRWQARHLLDFALHPRWSLGTLRAGVPRMANYSGASAGGYDRTAARRGADWEFLQRLRQRWRRTLVVKGVVCPDDAMRIRELGADAVYVSNHGGRQMDAAPATLQALRAIRDAVGPDYPLVLDGGLRSGEDIVKARACGADLVMLGRPWLYASASAGAPGVQALVQALREDMGIALAQLGCSAWREVGPQVLAERHLGHS